jgi:hypothetical protein
LLLAVVSFYFLQVGLLLSMGAVLCHTKVTFNDGN